jgi:hypothetical protein
MDPEGSSYLLRPLARRRRRRPAPGHGGHQSPSSRGMAAIAHRPMEAARSPVGAGVGDPWRAAVEAPNRWRGGRPGAAACERKQGTTPSQQDPQDSRPRAHGRRRPIDDGRPQRDGGRRDASGLDRRRVPRPASPQRRALLHRPSGSGSQSPAGRERCVRSSATAAPYWQPTGANNAGRRSAVVTSTSESLTTATTQICGCPLERQRDRPSGRLPLCIFARAVIVEIPPARAI